MPANTNPVFTLTPAIGMAVIAVANANRDGTGTMATVATGATNGTRVDRVTVTQNGPTGTACSNGMIRLFIYDGSANTRLFAELPVTATTPSATVAGWTGTMVFDRGLILPSGYQLRVSTQLGTGGDTFAVEAFAGDF